MKEESLTNKFQCTVNNTGYFRAYYENFRQKLSPESLIKFSNLSGDEDRLRFVIELLPPCLNHEVPYLTKDSVSAKEAKENGNKVFVKGNSIAALQHYSDAIIKCPFEDTETISVAFANRSAVLYHLERYEEAIEDINQSLELSYPKELQYKVLERKAKCLLALRDHNAALDAFRKTLQALDDGKLVKEKKQKMQTDVQIMLGMLTKPVTKSGHVNALLPGRKNIEKNESASSQESKIVGPRNPMYPSVSNKVRIAESEEEGRHAIAQEKICPGETVLIEKAYCHVLLSDFALTHCQNCLKRAPIPYPCKTCSGVIFCSAACQKSCQSSYHRYECPITNALYRSGASVMVQMALRILTQSDFSFFQNIKQTLQVPREKLGKLRGSDYRSVYHLVRHENERTSEDFLERTVMAAFLLNLLKQVGYFNGENIFTDDEIFIGGLILRHLQLLQFNAHEISELETECLDTLENAKSIFIGGGLFPTLSLFNHSCNPGVVRYFNGTTVTVRTIRTIELDQPVPENYGPMFTIANREQRRKTLKSQYWFDCGCKACQDDWPVIGKMNKSIFRFKCNANGPQCAGVLLVPQTSEDFMIRCSECQEHTNIFKGLKALQDTEAMFRQASSDMNRGNFPAALNVYLEILLILDQHLAPPFCDYYVCQEAIRKCMLGLGNKYTKQII